MKLTTIIIGLLLLAGGAANGEIWPQVREIDMTIGVDSGAERILWKVPIYGNDGTVLYQIICRGGTDEYLDGLTDRVGINFVGPLGCRLHEGLVEVEHSLLAEPGFSPWHSRGHFSHRMLIGDCGAYPEFGRLRHFRLRGFELTFEVTDVIMDGVKVSYFDLNIKLRNDRSAISRDVEPVDVENPFASDGTLKC